MDVGPTKIKLRIFPIFLCIIEIRAIIYFQVSVHAARNLAPKAFTQIQSIVLEMERDILEFGTRDLHILKGVFQRCSQIRLCTNFLGRSKDHVEDMLLLLFLDKIGHVERKLVASLEPLGKTGTSPREFRLTTGLRIEFAIRHEHGTLVVFNNLVQGAVQSRIVTVVVSAIRNACEQILFGNTRNEIQRLFAHDKELGRRDFQGANEESIELHRVNVLPSLLEAVRKVLIY